MALREYLIAGLGNTPYPNTRHSVGHLVVTALAKHHRASLRPVPSIDCLCAEAVVPVPSPSGSGSPEDVRFVFALNRRALMNISGPPIALALKHHFGRADPSKLLLVHDSIYHAPCSVKLKAGGSAKGHNGVKSVQSALGTQDFMRVQCGIGEPNYGDLAEYVLEGLGREEMGYWTGEGVVDVWDVVCEAIVGGGKKKQKPPKKTKAEMAQSPER